MSETSLKVSRKYDVSCEDVFDAWTNPESMASWFSPMTTCVVPKMELRPGGEYQIDMAAAEGNKAYSHRGKYLEVDRPHRLVFTWISEGTEQTETQVTVDIQPAGEGCELTLTHVDFPNAESMGKHLQGWKVILEKCAGLFGAEARG
jgi:uncharacterized protein YndB with AHSA1/START domain